MISTDFVALVARNWAVTFSYCEYQTAAKVTDPAILATIATMEEWQQLVRRLATALTPAEQAGLKPPRRTLKLVLHRRSMSNGLSVMREVEQTECCSV